MRRSRNSSKPITDKPVIIHPPSPRDIEIFNILRWHRFLPSHWVRHHFPAARTSQDFITHLGHLREDQNAYLKWSDAPLNIKHALGRHGIYELAPRGYKAIDVKPPRLSKQEHPHELIVSLHECSLKFQARANNLEFQFLDIEEYRLPSGSRWVPDGHPMIIGDTLIHSEIERRKYNESPLDTEEKLVKAHEYMKARLHRHDGFDKAFIAFLSATQGRTETLKRRTEEKFGRVSFFLFGTTQDWAYDSPLPDPKVPLVPVWERVGHDPMDLFQPATKGGAQ